jgi:hypothetical protein
LQNSGYLLNTEMAGQPLSKDCFKALCDVDNPISLLGRHSRHCPPGLRSTHLDLGQSEQTLDLTDEAIEFDRLDVIIVAACFYRLVAIAAHRARA